MCDILAHAHCLCVYVMYGIYRFYCCVSINNIVSSEKYHRISQLISSLWYGFCGEL